jgi:hypothetical protein
VSDLDETSGQDVVEKPGDELLGAEGDVFSVLGCEADPFAVDTNQPMRRDGDPVGVAPKVIEESLGPGEGTLGVNQPVFPIEFVFEQAKSFLLIDGKLGAVTNAPVVEGSRELFEELAAEKLGEGLDGKEKSGTGACPTGKTLVEPPTGDDAMQVGMEHELPSPGMKHGGEAKKSAESVLSEGEEGFGGGLEEESEDDSGVALGDGPELARQREDDVEVVGRQQAEFLVVEPSVLGEVETLGAMPVAARVIRGLGIAATRADVEVSTEPGGAAVLDGPHRLSLLGGQSVLLTKGLSMIAEDIGDIEERSFRTLRAPSMDGGLHLPEGFGAGSAEKIQRAIDASDEA